MAALSAAPIILKEIFLLIAARLGSDPMILRSLLGNTLAPQVAHFDDNVATDKAGELGKKAPSQQSPEAFPDCHILSSRSARHILGRVDEFDQAKACGEADD